MLRTQAILGLMAGLVKVISLFNAMNDLPIRVLLVVRLRLYQCLKFPVNALSHSDKRIGNVVCKLLFTVFKSLVNNSIHRDISIDVWVCRSDGLNSL